MKIDPERFIEQLPALVALAGGITRSAEILEVSRQTIHAWLVSQNYPSKPARYGIMALLDQAAESDLNAYLDAQSAKDAAGDTLSPKA